MKFLKTLAIVVAALLLIVGCKKDDTKKETTEKTTTETTETKTEEKTEDKTEDKTEETTAGGEIHVVSREVGSGTRGAFTEITKILSKNDKGEEVDSTYEEATIVNSTEGVITAVNGDALAIGYISLGSLNDEVKAVKVDGVEATPDKPANIEGRIAIAGSTSVTPLMEKLVDKYKELNPGFEADIQSNGSSAGIQAAIEGVAEIGMSSRNLKPEELEKVEAMPIAMDGIAVVVNNDNATEDISLDNIHKIFVGEVKDWNDVK